MKYINIILCLLFAFSAVYAENGKNESLLSELDRVIANKYNYHRIRENKILHLKDSMEHSTDINVKYNLAGALFYEYLHYQADSSLYYINKKAELMSSLDKPELMDEIHVNRSEVFGVMGMYNEADMELKKVDFSRIGDNDGLMGYYLRARRAYYGWLADYTADPVASRIYVEKTQLYRDSIMMHISSGPDYYICKAESMIKNGESDKALDILLPLLDDDFDPKRKVYVMYTMSSAYEALKDTANQIKYLAETAIKDIEMAEREYASLQKLALLMYHQGNLDRAYTYLTCSMEDAVAANARLRFLEVTQIYPIIDKAYKKNEARQRTILNRLFISVSILAFLLILATFYLYYWNKKLTIMRHNLYNANRQLVTANKELEETGRIKEVYIAKYLDRCVGYLEKLEQYRRSLEKLAMASKIDQLFKAIKSEEFLHDERKMFYNEFDKSFLNLFPNFIEDFNALLQDDAKVFPKKDEHLSTELRIFALIRLGVTDANRIAHFLGYSLATVYNYRSKIRNKAKGDKETFEQDVMNL